MPNRPDDPASFTLWAARSLQERYAGVLGEPLPRELIELLDAPHGRPPSAG